MLQVAVIAAITPRASMPRGEKNARFTCAVQMLLREGKQNQFNPQSGGEIMPSLGTVAFIIVAF